MLISALNEYYDYLSRNNKVLPEGYSTVNIKYIIGLSVEGEVKEIIDYRKEEISINDKGKEKKSFNPRKILMPKRTEKTGIDSNIIEHRPLYIFGLNYSDSKLAANDKTNKAAKSHEEFKKRNLEFIEDMDTPLINAYRKFMLNWVPEDQTENQILLNLGKDYITAGYVFCLEGHPEKLLHDELEIKEKWIKLNLNKIEDSTLISQCAITGEKKEIARLHGKIKGVYGGQASGTVLVGFNNECDESYGNKQGANGCISEKVMEHYTEALNYLLANKTHKVLIDEITVVFFAMNDNDICENQIQALLFGNNDEVNVDDVNAMLKSVWENGRKGVLTNGQLNLADTVTEDIDFYMIGLKPNASRLSVKFIYKKRFSDILYNIAMFQKEAAQINDMKPVALWEIKRELISPKSTSEKVNPALVTKVMEAIIMGYRFPISLLDTLVRRVKTDKQEDIGLYRNKIRMRIIKAYINRNLKEDIGMSLDKTNVNQAYLCGRLFAVLEKIQIDVSKTKLNRTIKDTYFSSACSKPAIVFPIVLKLAQNHLNKLNNPVFYNKLICEIIGELDNKFPENLSLNEQGNFIIGYYQQTESLYTKKVNDKEEI